MTLKMEDNLFIKSVEFEKTAIVTRLDRDPSTWTKTILDQFFSEYPQFMSSNVELEYKKKDAEKGYAVAILSSDGLIVPVTIKDFGMAPLDVVYKGGVPLPLSQQIIQDLSENKSAFGGLEKPRDDEAQSFFNNPTVDLQMGASKHASVIDKVSSYGAISKAQKDIVLDMINADESVKVGFELNGTSDILNKLAELNTSEEHDFTDSVSKNLDRDIHYIYKEGRFNRKAIFGSSKVDDPITVDLDSDEPIEKYGAYRCWGQNTLTKLASVTEGAVYNIKGGDEQLFIYKVAGDLNHSLTYGHDASESSLKNTFTDGLKPEVGQYGTFVKGAEALKPFEVRGVINNRKYYEVEGFDGLEKVSYIPVKGIENIEPHEQLTNTYYLPADYSFIKVGEPKEASQLLHQYFDPTSNTAHKYTKDDVGTYSMYGPEFEKYSALGHEVRNIPLQDAI